MTLVRSNDADFRVCEISLHSLMGLQTLAERSGFSTRWSSPQALRSQVRDAPILLMTVLRQERADALCAYRCFLLFEPEASEARAAITTFDIAPDQLLKLPRLDRDVDVRSALTRLFGIVYEAKDVVAKD